MRSIAVSGIIPTMLVDILQRIDRRLAAVGLSESRAATLAGLSDSAIRDMRRAVKRGRVKGGASTRTLAALAPVLKTNPAWLLDGVGVEDGEPSPLTPVRLISWVSAGALRQPDVSIEDADDLPIIMEPGLPPGDWIALRVDGDSMNLVSAHNSIIFVNRKDRRLIPGEYYVIGDGEGWATYKRYRPPNTWEPNSSNPVHQPFTPKNEPEIIGRVWKSVLRFGV